MAGFALLMKARADDRRLFTATDDAGNLQPPKLNVLSLQESKGLNVDELSTHLASFKVQRATITALVDTFEHAKTFGSLIQIPYALKTHLTVLPQVLALVKQSGDMYASAAADDLLPLVQQAGALAMQFDSVVANPPYMGSKGMNSALKDYAKATFPDSKSDLFAMFMERGFEWCKPSGFNSMVTMQSWMFLSSYEAMREKLLTQRTIQTMAHLGARAFAEISGEVVQTTAFVFQEQRVLAFKPTFFRLIDGQEAEKEVALRTNQQRFDNTTQDDFKKIPGSPLAYWLRKQTTDCFEMYPSVSNSFPVRSGIMTGNDPVYLRLWFEVNLSKIGFELSDSREMKSYWYPLRKLCISPPIICYRNEL
jgi:type II restriction/modification system DNA methylase subunit YeeA